MLTLSSRSAWVRFAYWGSQYGIPNQTTLCAFFWRIVIKLLVFTVLLTLLSLYGYAWIFYTWKTFLNTAVFVGLLGGLIGLAVICTYLETATPWRRDDNLFGAVVQGIKKRYCPVIRIEREE